MKIQHPGIDPRPSAKAESFEMGGGGWGGRSTRTRSASSLMDALWRKMFPAPKPAPVATKGGAKSPLNATMKGFATKRDNALKKADYEAAKAATLKSQEGVGSGQYRAANGKIYNNSDMDRMSPEDILRPVAGTGAAIGGILWLLDVLNDKKSFPDYPADYSEFAPPGRHRMSQEPVTDGPRLSPEQMLQLISGQGVAPSSTEASPPPPGNQIDYLLQQAFGNRNHGPMPMEILQEMMRSNQR